MALRLFALAAILASIIRIGFVVHGYVPVDDWMMWPILGYWGCALYFCMACLGLGTALLGRIGDGGFTAAERPVLGMTVGVLSFGLIVFCVGLAGGLTQAFAWLAPGACIASCGLRGWRHIARDGGQLMTELMPTKLNLLNVGVLALATTVLAAVYLPILTPHNIQHDARWYHLPIAAQYAAQGSVTPFQEGWFLGAYPHFSSLLYTWALLLPFDIVHRLGVAAHMEFALFVATIVALPSLLRRALPSAGKTSAWAAFFLFPGYLTYDSNLSLGADHIAALWAAPAAIVAVEFWAAPRFKNAALLGAFCAGAALTKYSAISLVIPLGLAVLARVLRIGLGNEQPWKSRLPHALGLAATFGAVFLVAWAPHWLKNWLWFGDPLYPVLHHYLAVTPWNPTSAALFAHFSDSYIEHGPRNWHGLLEGVQTALSFGFETNDYTFHGQRPVFGFLFAAVLPALPFLRLGRRVGALMAMCLVGIIVWYLTYTRDRYVQALLPWLSTVAAAGLLASWRSGWPALRAATATLIALQLSLQADVFFLRGHVMATGRHPLISLMDAVAPQFPGGIAGPGEVDDSAVWSRLGASLPKDAKILVHRQRSWLGLDRPVVVDESGWQAGIDYDRLENSRALLKTLKALGTSHVLMGDFSHSAEFGPETAGGEMLLWSLLHESHEIPWDGPYKLFRLPQEISHGSPVEVAVNLCKTKRLAPGTYWLAALQKPLPPPPPKPTPKLAPTENDVDGKPKPKPKPKPAHGPSPHRPLPSNQKKAVQPLFAITESGCRRPAPAYSSLPSRANLRLWWITPANPSRQSKGNVAKPGLKIGERAVKPIAEPASVQFPMPTVKRPMGSSALPGSTPGVRHE